MSELETTTRVAHASRVLYESPPLTPEDVVDTTAALATTFARDTSSAGVCVADGMGLQISVDRGALVVVDGVGPHCRERRFDKATHGLRRLVVLGATGTWSLDAMHWCRRLGIGVVVLAPDGTPVLESAPRITDDARIRRMQAQCIDLPVGLDLARELIGRKLIGQAALLAGRFDDTATADTIGELGEALAEVGTIDEVRQLEASAAALYWQSWTGRPECVPRFVSRDLKRVPPHWSRYEGRRSVLSSGNGNRKAERPVNALLSYGYALLEAETILACRAVGMDPGLGVIHSDLRARQSFALDLMEPVRPEVDAFVLDLLERRTFRKVEFTETSEGHCRLRPPLTHELAETLPQWARAIAPVAEHVAHTLGHAMAGKYEPATPLTRRRTRAAQAQIKARKAVARSVATSTTTRQRPTGDATPTLWSCPDCGGPVTNHRHVRCDTCIGADPRQNSELRGRRGAAIASRKQALRAWEEANPGTDYDPDHFRREILPGLQGVRLTKIMEAAGISKAYASEVRRGRYTPHVSTWDALARLTGAGLPQT